MNYMKLNYFTNDESFPLFIQFGGHNEDMFLHAHEDFFELVTVMSGSAVHVVDGERSRISKGDVFVIGNSIVHGFEEPQDFRICNIMFRPDMLFSGEQDIRQLPGFHALFLLEPYFSSTQHFQSRLKLTPADFTQIEPLLNLAESEYRSDSPGRKTMVFAIIRQIAVMLARLYDCPAKSREITGIADAAAFMEQSYSQDMVLSDVIERSHYSQRHFIRLFTSAYGMTPQKYLMNVRIRHACSMLRDSGLSVTEIAMRCGFSDPNYFSRIFKKHTGYSPSEFHGRTHE
ncbi:MAG: helix-turn-helix domain-containing protein [Oscillospiraceae bacterium]